jgi:xanthine dehydrogenase YagS FAD-binding subunit
MKGMKAFEYVNPRDLRQASQMLGTDAAKAKLLAGGIDLLTEMQAHIIEPDRIVNLKSIRGLNSVRRERNGLFIGPLVTLAMLERDAGIRRDYTALAEAAHSVGSPQIRQVGTLGGNLCQRPRCWYYRDETIICFKKGGTKCYAMQEEGANKYNAILGGGPSFIVHPSDCAPALVALDAVIRYGTGDGRPKEVAAEKFFVLPSDRLHFENVLEPNELVEEIFIPHPKPGTRSCYLKFRERESFDWAMSSVAVAAQMEGNTIRDVRVVLGGVAPKPWRSPEAEAALKGKPFSRETANQAAEAALADAKPLSQNGYKVPLTKVLIRRAVELAATGKEPVTPVV